MNKPRTPLSRRDFLSRCSTLALGSSSALATMTQLQLAHAETQPQDDYKALVCVFLYGGNDAFNMVVPRSTSAYADYSATRQGLAVSNSDLIPISSNQQNGADYGLHPALTDIAELYSQQKLAILGNVGALVEPTTKAAYQAKTATLPPQLFSHNDQQNFLQSLQSTTKRNGWAGRAADVLGSLNTNTRLSMNISMSGSNLWQSGANVIPYSVNPEGLENIKNLNRKADPDTEAWELARVRVFENILAQPQSHILANAYSQQLTKAWDLSDEVGSALETIQTINTQYPEDNRLATGLKMTANLMAVRQTLKVSRQTFFIGVGDFDTHGDQNRRHNLLMAQVNNALKAFYETTVELGIADKVTTFTTSDFGRTLTSNGDGTDHGWGSHQFILGNSIAGGDIYGTMPDLAIGSSDDMGEGRIIPTTSMDQYAATLAGWFGLPASRYGEVFPNLGNFDITDLGFTT
ncbi:DUF1501 domain-containing protein [Teredinibacter haidensis]|mgnify:CR=1 FL=1|uniref:DUF1501 domain-containing protein n=1 Tax=Teredinibacter haidensis TaxID=2731755 RepID=UPI000948B47F|nr:DUF1501 domain-containing protein [Teredinibacter haidensis]